jgi:hypothetical protein
MINVSTAIGFLIVYWAINLMYSLEENGLFFFRTSQFRRETAWLGGIILFVAFFF